jgi:hypothetical protein
MISLEYSLTKEDVFDFIYYNSWAAREKKAYRVRYYLKIILLVYVSSWVFIILLRKGLPPAGFYLYMAVVGFISGILIGYLGVKRHYMKVINKMIANEDNAGYFSSRIINLDENGINARDKHTDLKLEWNAIKKLVESEKHYYLFISGDQAIVIPKKVLKPEEINELAILFERKLSLKASLHAIYKS